VSTPASNLEPGSGTRLAAFAGLSALAAWRYAGIEARPPTIKVLAVAAVPIAAGAALLLIRVRPDASRGARANAVAGRLLAIALVSAVALLAAGLPPRLLVPTSWGTLASGLRHGLQTMASTLWPYAGRDSWARLDILLALAVVPVAAAALGFWPAGGSNPTAAVRYGIRRVGALALLVALYLVGVIDSGAGSAIIDGLLLLALVVGWLWLPGLGARRVLPAVAWLAAAGAVAAVVAGELAGGQAWFDYRGWDLLGAGAQATAFTWDQTYGPIPWSRSQRTMFTVRASMPGLWKVTTLDRFDGLRFVRSGADVPSGADFPLPLNDRWYEFATFTVKGLSSALLPTEQGTTAGVNFGGRLAYRRDGTVQTLGGKLRSAERYTVLSYVPRPTAAELRAAPRAFPAAYLRYTDFDLPAPSQSGLDLPATDPPHAGRSFTDRTVRAPAPGLSPAVTPRVRHRILASPYAPIYTLARRLARGAHSTYDVVSAIESYLKANYAYSERTPARRYPLEAFLFLDREGYCQQFAGAMALMLRMDGIPARVAAGFLTGSYDSATGSYQVGAVDAHSWVEVYFTGIGWVPFDPTPPRSVRSTTRLPLFTQHTPNSLQAIAATIGGTPRPSGERIPTARHRRTTRTATDSRLALIAAALGSLVALVLLATRWLAGHVRLRRSLVGDGELATIELARALRRLGYGLPATVTLAQIERLVRLHGGPDAARYVQLLRERRYANGSVAVATLRERRRLRRGLTAHLGLDARLRGQWALPPGTTGWRIRRSA
jgi:transglutaminase-like putative cysteine protease